MLGVSAYVVIEAIGRIGNDVEVSSGPMLVVGGLGLVVNLIALLLLRGGASESLNVKGAYFEVIADTAGSVGVLVAGEVGRGVGAGFLRGAGDAVAGGIALPLAVVGGADDDGAVNVAVLEGDEDFLTGTRDEVATPVGTGDRGHDVQPDAEAFAGRGVVVVGGVRLAAGRLAAALPGELDAHAQVALGVRRLAAADDEGGEVAAYGRARVDVSPVLVGH